MTDYRDLQHPGLHSSRPGDYRSAGDNSTSLGGILIGLAVIGLIFVALTLFFGGSAGDQTTVAPAAVETPAPATPAPAPTPAQPAD